MELSGDIDPALLQMALQQLLAQSGTVREKPVRDSSVYSLGDESMRSKLVNAGNGRNIAAIACRDCGMGIIGADKVTLQDMVDGGLTMPTQVRGGQEPTPEPVAWLVPNANAFDNIAFSRPVDSRRYLLCCDCESEILGYQELPDGPVYLSHERVRFVLE